MPRHGVHRPAKANSGRSSLSSNHMGASCAASCRRIRGTKSRAPRSGFARRAIRAVRALYVANVGDRYPHWGGPGVPQRAMTSSCSPSAPVRTIGAIWSGKKPGRAAGCSSGHRGSRPWASQFADSSLSGDACKAGVRSLRKVHRHLKSDHPRRRLSPRPPARWIDGGCR